MRACVRCGALRPAPAQLCGAVRLLAAPVRVAPASRGSRGAGRRARLGQGCAARLSAAAAAAEGEPGPAAPQPGPVAHRGRGGPRKAADGEAAPLARRQRAPYPKRGEKTADGRPKPNERTVAYLVDLGWFKSEKEVVALLTRRKTEMNASHSRLLSLRRTGWSPRWGQSQSSKVSAPQLGRSRQTRSCWRLTRPRCSASGMP